jgi:hypothetical protein
MSGNISKSTLNRWILNTDIVWATDHDTTVHSSIGNHKEQHILIEHERGSHEVQECIQETHLHFGYIVVIQCRSHNVFINNDQSREETRMESNMHTLVTRSEEVMAGFVLVGIGCIRQQVVITMEAPTTRVFGRTLASKGDGDRSRHQSV